MDERFHHASALAYDEILIRRLGFFLKMS